MNELATIRQILYISYLLDLKKYDYNINYTMTKEEASLCIQCLKGYIKNIPNIVKKSLQIK